MKLTVAIPSRGRPLHVLKVIRLLHALASGQHQIVYVVGADADDPQTLHAGYAAGLAGPAVAVWCTKRLSSLGEMVNRMAQQYPADVYCSLCDDIEILTPGWDAKIAEAWSYRPDGLWWWQTLKQRPATYAIVSDRWYKAAGCIFTDYFPFWWDDVWLMQVWNLASGQLGLAVEAVLDDRPFATQRMRDLRFWTDFYTFCAPLRRAQAARVAKALGWPARTPGETIGEVRPEFVAKIDQVQAHQGDKGPPTPEYLAAKARAEAMMREGWGSKECSA